MSLRTVLNKNQKLKHQHLSVYTWVPERRSTITNTAPTKQLPIAPPRHLRRRSCVIGMVTDSRFTGRGFELWLGTIA